MQPTGALGPDDVFAITDVDGTLRDSKGITSPVDELFVLAIRHLMFVKPKWSSLY